MGRTDPTTLSLNAAKVITLLESLEPIERGIIKSIIREEEQGWDEKFDRLLSQIRAKTEDYSEKEINNIIDDAVKRVSRD